MNEMPEDEDPQPFPKSALHVFGLIRRRGGCMRIVPLLDVSGLLPDELAHTVNALAGRGWVEVTWRRPRTCLPHGCPERFREVECITITRFGRWRYPRTWILD